MGEHETSSTHTGEVDREVEADNIIDREKDRAKAAKAEVGAPTVADADAAKLKKIIDSADRAKLPKLPVSEAKQLSEDVAAQAKALAKKIVTKEEQEAADKTKIAKAHEQEQNDAHKLHHIEHNVKHSEEETAHLTK